MTKKPALTMVDPAVTGSQPPRQLGQHGMNLWTEVMADYDIADRGGIELLAQACAALDRVEALAEQIAHDGAVIMIRNVPKPHPALAAELAGRAFITRTLERLGLNLEAVKPIGPPPGGRRRQHAD